MKPALDLLAAVFADPANGARALDDLRARWHDLAPEEREALTPLARLAADRVRAAAARDETARGDAAPTRLDPAGVDAARGYATPRPDATMGEEEAPARHEAAVGADAAPTRHDPAAAGADAAPRHDAVMAADAAHGDEAARHEPPAGRDEAGRDDATTRDEAARHEPPAGRDEAGRDEATRHEPAAGGDEARDAAQLALGEPPASPHEPARHAPAAAPRDPDALLSLLGLTTFRPGQREAVQAALDGRDALVVMPTGGGKSLCYQLPALASTDLTVVVSPLIALMRDQCARLTDLGHPAVMLASGEDNQSALEQIRTGQATIVFAAPERFASPTFRATLKHRRIALFVVDEAHCVSEWGHDFRPDYLRLTDIIKDLGHPPTMACTATATPKVAEEIVARLGLRDPERVRSGFDRPNLSFDVLPFDGEGSVARKRATLIAGLNQPENRPAIVYCGTRKSTEETAALLASEHIDAVAYHAGMPQPQRTEAQDAFMRGDKDVVVATNAFGMGVDKADVRSVWHWALPSSLEAYYQEAGRAGRDGEPAKAVLLASRSDLGRLVRFIKEAEVTVDQVVQRIGETEVDPSDDRDRIRLAVAERAGAVTLEPASGGRVRVTPTGRVDRAAIARLCKDAANRRWQSYRSIEHYAATGDRCRRRQLLDHFGDPSPGRPQGRCCDVHDPPTWVPPITTRGKKAPIEDGPPVPDEQLAPLKAWRKERADGKPAYTVATDATLREIIRRQPRSEQELLQIKGIGNAFVAKHAESLLELLQ